MKTLHLQLSTAEATILYFILQRDSCPCDFNDALMTRIASLFGMIEEAEVDKCGNIYNRHLKSKAKVKL